MKRGRVGIRTVGSVAAVVSALTLAACGGSSGGDGGAASSSPAKLEVIVPNAAAYWASVICGVKEQAKTDNATVQVQNGKEYTATDQIPLLNAAMARQPDGLVIVPADSNGMVAPLTQAKADGVKIATAGIGLAPDKASGVVNSQVITNDVAGGEQAGEAMAQQIGEKGTVLVMGTVAGFASTDDRVKGIIQALKKYPGITVLPTQYNKNEANTASSLVSSTLAAHPDLAGIVANNLVGVNGSITGLRQEKAAAGKVKLVGFDADPAEVEALTAGDVQGLVVANPKQLGVEAAKNVIAAIRGGQVTADVKIENTLVTKENMEQAEVKELLAAPSCA